jgi:hypothetical protein
MLRRNLLVSPDGPQPSLRMWADRQAAAEVEKRAVNSSDWLAELVEPRGPDAYSASTERCAPHAPALEAPRPRGAVRQPRGGGSGLLMNDKPLSQEQARQLRMLVHASIDQLGGDGAFVDEDEPTSPQITAEAAYDRSIST